MSLIVGQGVGKYYGALDVFENISFSIEQDDCVGLVGPNGEGKTTLLRILADLEDAEQLAGSVDQTLARLEEWLLKGR